MTNRFSKALSMTVLLVVILSLVGAVYNTQSASATTITTPTIQATNITFSNISASQFTASWTRGNGSFCIAFVKAADSGTAAPVNDTTYTANAAFGSGSQLGTTGWYCVYRGTATSVTVTGLSAATSYRVHVCEYNGSSSTSDEHYNTGSSTNNPKSQTTNPLTNVGGLAHLPNKPFILALWVALAAAVMAGAIMAVRWQKARS